MTERPTAQEDGVDSLNPDEPPFEPGRATRSAYEHPLKQWLLISGNRLVVSTIVLVVVFTALLLATVVWPLEMQQLATEEAAAERLFNTLLGGTILLVSIVVSINSIVLSQDLTSIGTQRDRLEDAVEFRSTVEDLADIGVAPTDPVGFLRAMIELLIVQTDALDAALDRREPELDGYEGFDQHTQAFLGYVRTHTGHVSNRISSDDVRSIDVLLAGLSYDYGSDAETARWIALQYEDVLTDDERESIDEIGETLRQFAIALEYFKSLIYMREFAKLSKTMLYVSLPVIVFTSYVLLAITSGGYPEFSSGRISSLSLFLSLAYTIALAPYVVLTTFVLRSASIASRSLATGPFVMDPA